jgi:hypothetical protein
MTKASSVCAFLNHAGKSSFMYLLARYISARPFPHKAETRLSLSHELSVGPGGFPTLPSAPLCRDKLKVIRRMVEQRRVADRVVFDLSANPTVVPIDTVTGNLSSATSRQYYRKYAFGRGCDPRIHTLSVVKLFF